MSPGHRTYLEAVVEQLRRFPGLFKDPWREIEPHLEAALTLALLDLEPARKLLDSCYCDRSGGRVPRDPVAMLRCLVLMGMVGSGGPNGWVRLMNREPALVVLAGFALNDRPGVGTFYDFFNRLLDGTWEKRCEHNRRPSDKLGGSKGRFRRNLKREKEQLKAETQAELAMGNETRVENLVRKALASLEGPIPKDLLSRVEEILFSCAVVPSVEMGLLGDPAALDVAGDGSTLPSGASGIGRPLCQCRTQGEQRCDCDRLFSDPDARWGYDSSNKVYFFGYRLHAMVAKNGAVELPLHLMVRPANTPDVVMGVEAASRLHKLLREHLVDAAIDHAIFDAGYDATAFHRLLLALSSKPVIALIEKNFAPADDIGQERDEQGWPLCPGGELMRFHGYNRAKGVTVFNCPAKRPGRVAGEHCYRVDLSRCPLGRLCDPDSSMGPFLYLRPADEPRLNPAVPRNTEEYTQAMNKRTCTERFNSFVKEAGGLGHRPFRRSHIILTMTLSHALRRHAMEWVKQRFGNERPGSFEEVLAVFESLLSEDSPKSAVA